MEAKSELTKIPGIGMNMAELEGLMMMVTLRTFEDDDIGISIKQIIENKRDYLPLLLLGDEVESGIMQYLDRCGLFALYDDDLRCVCAVTDESKGTLEVQNLATDERYQRKGYASKMLEHVCAFYRGKYDRVILGTGEVPGVLYFYPKSPTKL